ncbi:uncharacterized protein LOC128857661 [Anastrepha ludens]|uniref:uncharacterized protein LOC128857661 n=1 Tax=Anastrepha ludens TaxID=28586 RepID=UPI0023B1C451|nr:uncharacterized protein LOC128857661 [Anastrepha ludens]
MLGVRHCCMLSPLLVNLVLDQVIRRASAEDRGRPWGLNGYLEDVDYADGIFLMAHKHSHQRRHIRFVSLQCNENQHRQDEANLMFINTIETQAIYIADIPLGEVGEFYYRRIIRKIAGEQQTYHIGRPAIGQLDKV